MRHFTESETERIMGEEIEAFQKKGLLIEPVKRALEMRPFMVKGDKFLVSDFTGTAQLGDIRKKTDGIIDKKIFSEQGLAKLIYRCKVWNGFVDPEERAKLGLPKLGSHDLESLKKLTRTNDYLDVNLWFGPDADLPKYNLAFAFQSLGCNFHDQGDYLGCYFCFVDKKNNCPELGQSSGVFIDEQNILDTYEAAVSDPEWIQSNNLGWIEAKGGLNHIRHTGGQITPVLDLTLRIAQEIEKRGLPVRLMYDNNLSTAKAIRHLISDGTFPADILEQLAHYNVPSLVAFKGTSDANIQYNTQSSLTLEDQFDELAMHVSSGQKCYMHLYNANPFHLRELVSEGKERFENFLPMLHLPKMSWYGPTEEHIRARALVLGKNPDEYFALQKELITFMHVASKDIMNTLCLDELKVPYRATSRRDVVEKQGGLILRK